MSTTTTATLELYICDNDKEREALDRDGIHWAHRIELSLEGRHGDPPTIAVRKEVGAAREGASVPSDTVLLHEQVDADALHAFCLVAARWIQENVE